MSPKSEPPSTPFADVLIREVLEIKDPGSGSRQAQGGSPPDALREILETCPDKYTAAFRLAAKARLFGLAFSGGGIRSATFNLGVLQALADFGLLNKLDYLSTVSGGGYIGSWLTAWILRLRRSRPVEPGTHEKQVLQDIHKEISECLVPGRRRDEAPQISWLREHTNYLTPRMGLASGDTWAMVGSYLRNLLLNQTILVLFLSAVLLAVFMPLLAFIRLTESPHPFLFGVGAALLLLSLTVIVANVSNLMKNRLQTENEDRAGAGPFTISLLVLFPLLASAFLVWAWWWSLPEVPDQTRMVRIGGTLLASLWVLSWILGSLSKKRRVERVLPADAVWNVLALVVGGAIAGAVGGWLLSKIPQILQLGFSELPCPGYAPLWRAGYWGIPLTVVVFLLVETLHIGIVGRRFSEQALEWWARVGGLLLFWTLCLAALTFITLEGPWLVERLLETYPLQAGWMKWTAATLWAALTGAGVLAGKSAKSGGEDGNRAIELLGKFAPHIFVVGLLLLLAMGIHGYFSTLPQASGHLAGWDAAQGASECSLLTPPTAPLHRNYWDVVRSACKWSWVAFPLLALAVLFSWRVGVNKFSMHGMYRNRLVRCYLGASHNGRRPHPFTGFDFTDDLPLKGPPEQTAESLKNVWERLPQVRFANLVAPMKQWGQDLGSWAGRKWKGLPPEPLESVRPFPIVNTALNLVGGKELAWQQRKAASFMITPRFSGYEFPTLDSRRCRNPISALRETYDAPLSLGTVMAISGAAASPNMGYHSSIPLAFLMTVFNVRLGWWMGNPRFADPWKSPEPAAGLLYLLCELVGKTDHQSNYIYLSDGGHFENLGIYELVRRRCRYILACDAGEDHEMKFGDLGNAVEKCRADFGIPIDICVDSLRRETESSKSPWHCAVGTIHYEQIDPEIPAGTLVYLKASLTGDEPADVLHYAAEHPSFPHESTADQFFDESQFESYRMLGQHIAESVVGAAADKDEVSAMDLQDFFVLLRQRWYPPSRSVTASFTQRTATFSRMMKTLRTHPDLAFLDSQFYLEWSQLMNAEPAVIRRPGSPPNTFWLPPTEWERRAGFYFCHEMLQMMEDAYVDLNLEEEYDHPDNRGWMNCFLHWSASGMLRATWAISASNFGARFQRFCERHLDLRLGEIRVGDPFSPDQLHAAQEDGRLNYFEVRLIDAFVQVYSGPRNNLSVIPLQIRVGSPDSPSADDPRQLAFTFGFALAEITSRGDTRAATIVFFRVQNHLRKMGLARNALRELYRRYSLTEKVPLSELIEGKPAKVKKEILEKDPSLREAFPSQEDVLQFRQLFESARAYGYNSTTSLNP